MAAYETYDTTGEAEDVQDVIFNVSPVDTPVMSMSRDMRASARLHEWLEDQLSAAAANAAIEGASAAFTTPTPPVAKSNHTQIFQKTAEVSGTLEAVRLYGRDGAMAYELARKYQELANDMELAIVGTPNHGSGAARQTGTAGTSGSAGRQLASLQSQLAAGVVINAEEYLPDSGDVGSELDPITTITHLEQTILSANQATYNEGGNPDYMIVPPSHAVDIAGFANAAGRTRDIANERVVVNTIDLYVSPFSSEMSVVLDRNLDSVCILLLDFEYLCNAVLRPTTDWEIAKIGDAERRQILGERTFCVLNSKAHAMVDNIPASLSAS